MFPKTNTFQISKTEIFRFNFQLGSNLRDPTGTSRVRLSFQTSKNSFLIKELHITDTEYGIDGEVKVELEEQSKITVVSDEGCCCFKKEQNINQTITNITFKELTKLNFNVSNLALQNFSYTDQQKVNTSEKSTMPDVWWWSSLKELASILSDEEAEHMAIQLNLKREDVEKLQSSENKQQRMASLVFKHWKDSVNALMRIKQVQTALDAIGRQELAIAFRKAHLDNVPFQKLSVEENTNTEMSE